MTTVRSIDDVGQTLVVLDEERRLYAGLSRDESYWHVVAPLQLEILGRDGEVIRAIGQLSCRCKSGVVRGTCYRVVEAEAIEAAGPSWMREPEAVAG
jgi:hypothetical protein